MERRYLYIMDPIESIDPKSDTTFNLMLESQNRGTKNFICSITDLINQDGKGFAQASAIEVNVPSHEDESHFKKERSKAVAFADFDVIFMRKDPPIDQKYNSACMLLLCHDPKKTLVLNNPHGLLVANEKLWGLKVAPDLMPPTVVSSNLKALKEACNQMGKVVLKPLFQAGGGGILVLEKDDFNLSSALEILTDNGQKPMVVQKFIAGARNGDKRIILLGGKPIGALLRVPHGKDHRANLHAGASTKKASITESDKKIADALEPKLLELGIHFAGIDVIEGKLTEINVTSPMGLPEIDVLDKNTGQNKLNIRIMNYIDQLLLERQL